MIKKGFTLAEVLITLTVIGIVAAISLPALMQNVNERSWDAKRKALHSRMAAAIGQIEDIANYGKYETKTTTNPDNTATTEQIDTQAESFVVDGLSKVYKIKNVCNSVNIDKCGISKTYTNLQGESRTLAATGFSRKAVSFETANGESIAVYYNPNCASPAVNATSRNANNVICVNFIYDLNGPDEPNEMGKDMGVMSVVYDANSDPEVVAPNPYYASAGSGPSYAEDGTDAASLCKKKGSNLSLPSVNDLISITYNSSSTGISQGVSGSIRTTGKDGTVWFVQNGNASSVSRSEAKNVACVIN